MNTTSKNNSENKVAAQDTSVKKNNGNTSAAVASGVGAVAGAAAGVGAGVVIGSVISPDEASASETVHHEFDADDNFFNLNDDDVKPVEATRDLHVESVHPIEVSPEPAQSQEPVVTEAKVETIEQVEVVEQPEDEVQVTAYQRMTNPENGQTAEIAVVIENGEEVGYLDADVDGYADIRIQDTNHDGNIDYSTEAQDVSGQHIEMQPFQEAFEHQPDFNNNNDMADYVNNADVDNFMA